MSTGEEYHIRLDQPELVDEKPIELPFIAVDKLSKNNISSEEIDKGVMEPF